VPSRDRAAYECRGRQRQTITRVSVDQFVNQLGQPDTPELRDRIKEQLIEREVFLQESHQAWNTGEAGRQVSAGVRAQDAIIQNLFKDELKKHPITALCRLLLVILGLYLLVGDRVLFQLVLEQILD